MHKLKSYYRMSSKNKGRNLLISEPFELVSLDHLVLENQHLLRFGDIDLTGRSLDLKLFIHISSLQKAFGMYLLSQGHKVAVLVRDHGGLGPHITLYTPLNPVADPKSAVN